MWTNGLEFFFVEKEQKRFETRCNPIGDWPIAEESVGTKDVIFDAPTRVADNEMLKITFRRCHNFIHGNEGMPKDAAFWQFLYLIFCKMHNESLRTKQRHAWQRRFWAGPKEQFEEKGRKEIRKRIEELLTEVKKQYKNIFRGNEEITLSDLRELKELLELIPGATLGMWTNGQEEFLFEVERARFEVRQKPLGVWPVPGEATSDLSKTGGVIQVAADAEGLEDALLRAHRYINRNLV